MKKSQIVGNILKLSRMEKEILLDSFDEIKGILSQKTAADINIDPQAQFTDMIKNEIQKKLNLQNIISKYMVKPNEALKSDIFMALEDIVLNVRELNPTPEFEQIAAMMFNQMESNFDGFLSQLVGQAIQPQSPTEPAIAPQEEQPKTNVISNQIKETKKFESGGKQYAVINNVFTVPLDKSGNYDIGTERAAGGQILQQLLTLFVNHSGKFAPTSIESEEVTKKLRPHEMDLVNQFFDITNGPTYGLTYEDMFLLRRMIQRNEKGELDPKNPHHQRVTKELNTDSLFQQIGNDLLGTFQRWYVGERIGMDLYSKIMNFAGKVYGENYEKLAELGDLSKVLNEIASGNTSAFDQEIVISAQEIISDFAAMGIDQRTMETNLNDYFATPSLKYFKSLSENAKNWQLQKELLGINGDNVNLSRFCPKCGRFRPSPDTQSASDLNKYYKMFSDGLHYDVQIRPYDEMPLDPVLIENLSPQAKQILSKPCENGCRVGAMVPNYFARQDDKQNDPTLYWGFKPVSLGNTVLNQKKGTEDIPIMADDKYISYLNETYTKLVQSLPPEQAQTVLSDLQQLVVLGKEYNFNENKEKNPDYVEKAGAAQRIFDYMVKAMYQDQQRLADIQQFSQETGLDPEETVKMFAFKDFFRLLPPDIPTPGWNTAFHFDKSKYNIGVNLKYEDTALLLDKERLAAEISSSGKKEISLQYIQFMSTGRVKQTMIYINRFIQKLAMEFMSELENDTDQDLELSVQRFLGMKRIRMPWFVEEPTSSEMKDPIKLKAYQDKIEAIKNATSIEQLEAKGLTEDVDFMVMDFPAEQVAEVFRDLLYQYRRKLRTASQVKFDPHVMYEGAKWKDMLNIEKMKQDPTVASVRFHYGDMFKNAMRQAITINNQQPINLNSCAEFYSTLGLAVEDDDAASYPLEYYAMGIMYQQLKQQRSMNGVEDLELIKLALQDDLRLLFTANRKKYNTEEETVMAMSGIYNSNPNFLNGVKNDVTLEKFRRFTKPTLPEAGKSRFVDPAYMNRKGDGSNLNYYSAGLDTLVKFLLSDDEMGKAILEATSDQSSYLEAEMRQVLSMLMLYKYNAEPDNPNVKNHVSSRDIAYLLTNAMTGTMPLRNDSVNIFGNAGATYSLASFLFKKLPVNWLGESFAQWFNPRLDLGRRKERLDTKKVKKAEVNNWYRKAQHQEENKFAAVLITSVNDMFQCANNFTVYGQKNWGYPTYLPVVMIVPFEEFGSLAKVKKFEKNSDYNTYVLDNNDMKLLGKMGLIKYG